MKCISQLLLLFINIHNFFNGKEIKGIIVHSDGESVAEMNVQVDYVGQKKSLIGNGMMIQSVGKISDINLWDFRMISKFIISKVIISLHFKIHFNVLSYFGFLFQK